MKKAGSRARSGNGGRSPKFDASNGRGSGRSRQRLDPEVETWFAGTRAAYPSSRSSLIPMLQSAQTALGYLPPDAMRVIARHIGVPAAMVEGVASFYAQFRFDKPGRHRVTVCSGTACYVRGSGKLMDDLKADLEIMPGKTTADGAITLESVSCFGACALAPVVVVNGKVLRQQTSASLKKVIEGISVDRVVDSLPDAAPPPIAPEGRK
jgi:NADH-quinone oxidoreductase subunit E